jgi:hypothetical protein
MIAVRLLFSPRLADILTHCGTTTQLVAVPAIWCRDYPWIAQKAPIATIFRFTEIRLTRTPNQRYLLRRPVPA